MAVSNVTCTLTLTIPNGEDTAYVTSNIEVVIEHVVSGSTVTTLHNPVDTDVSITQATVSNTGSIEIDNVPIYYGSNRYVIKHYNNPDFALATEEKVVTSGGAYITGY